MASLLAAGLTALPGVSLVHKPQANELFVAMPDAMIEGLFSQGAYFYRWIAVAGETRPVVRLVTAFSTQPEEVATFLRLAAGYSQK